MGKNGDGSRAVVYFVLWFERDGLVGVRPLRSLTANLHCNVGWGKLAHPKIIENISGVINSRKYLKAVAGLLLWFTRVNGLVGVRPLRSLTANLHCDVGWGKLAHPNIVENISGVINRGNIIKAVAVLVYGLRS